MKKQYQYNSIECNPPAESTELYSQDHTQPDYSNNVLTSKLKSSPHERSSSYIMEHPPRVPFYSSGLGFTFSHQRRAWVDPWEANPSDRFLSDTQTNAKSENIATSMLLHENRDNVSRNSSITYNAEELPSMSYLHNGPNPASPDMKNKENLEQKETESSNLIQTEEEGPRKFGAWDGVMTGCLLNIFGVIMFLRVGWVVGQCGILAAIGIMCISTSVTITTSFSMSAICTNGTILAGGAYYIISRTLGPAFGGSIGILFSFGNMMACSMYLIGFAETLADNLKDGVMADDFSITGNYVNDVRIWSNIVLIVVLILALVGLKWVIKAQISLLVFISFAIVTFFVGSFYKTEENTLYAVDGWVNGNFEENLTPKFVDGYDFWTVLAIFFPAVTGIMAGANLSGDLKNPSHDIPMGTLSAVGISSIVYMLMAIVVGAVAARSELVSNILIMADICVWNYIVFIGIYSATLSSAIASLVGAPRILMAIAEDNIISVPGIAYFSATDSDGQPVRGYFLSFAVAFMFNCIGELNAIAPLISQFFLIAYLMINFGSFVMEISHSPGWRPSFKMFNRYTSFLGTAVCLSIMFLLDWVYALSTTLLAFIIYLFITWKDPGVSWGGALDSRSIYSAYKSVLQLGFLCDRKWERMTVNWRPSFLLVHLAKTGGDVDSDPVTRFVETLRKGPSLIFVVEIIIGEYRSYLWNKLKLNKEKTMNSSGYLPVRQHISSRIHFQGKRVNGFCNKIISTSYRNGVQSSLQIAGLGLLKPNTLVIRMKTDDEKHIDNDEYVEILRDSLLSGCGVMICCGFDRINWNMSLYAIDDNNKYINNIIDLWWMVDDGGLTLLLPYIMCLHPFFTNCRVRINLITDGNQYSSTFYEENVIKELIKKFRLNNIYRDEPRIIHVINNEINNKTLLKFEYYSKCKISTTTRQKVICRWLRLSELLIEYSSNCSMIIVTLPVPTNFITSNQYMAILKLMANQKELPPIIIMRGNGQQTLTFHSE